MGYNFNLSTNVKKRNNKQMTRKTKHEINFLEQPADV